jgi:hypothetical protein
MRVAFIQHSKNSEKVGIILKANPEETARVRGLHGAEVVIVESEVYSDLVRDSSMGVVAWNATADALGAALAQVATVPEGYGVTWWVPLGSKVAVFGLKVEPTAADTMQGLLVHTADEDPGLAFGKMVDWLAELN